MPDKHDEAKVLKGSVTEAIGKITADPQVVDQGEKQKREGRADEPRPSPAPPARPSNGG